LGAFLNIHMHTFASWSWYGTKQSIFVYYYSLLTSFQKEKQPQQVQHNDPVFHHHTTVAELQ
jgi:hypothetical protein